VPEKAEKRRPTNFEFSSKRAGYSRYTCPEVKGMVKRLEKVEEDSKSQMGLFIGFFFEEFKKKQNIWQKFIDILAEVDCLISLAEYSLLNKKVRPQFVEHGFSIKGARHPALTNIEFIPNNVNLVQKVMLLTGPNMGGKSTLLRTVCCLAVLAQMGCYVPCEEYQCETIDRIFTRIGASDRL
jgi:DNA mismatch repair protein MSH6